MKTGSNTNWEIGEVLEYHAGTHSMDVRTMTGRELFSIPRLATDPKEFTLLQPGTTVAVSYDLPFPVVVGVIPIPAAPQPSLGDTAITGVPNTGADDPLQRTDGTLSYKHPEAPTDLKPGDRAWVGPMGNAIALLDGGVNIVGSPTAEIRTNALLGLVETFAQRQRNISDWGEWKIENDQGKVSYILRAGANQTNHTGIDEEHWVIRLDVGATGDLFNFQITTPTGNTLFKFYVGPDGRTEIFGLGGVDISSGNQGNKEQRHDIAGDHTQNVAGNHSKRISGTSATTFDKSETKNIATDKTTAIGNDLSIAINRHKSLNVGGQYVETIAGGAATDARPDQLAKKTNIVNGGWEIDIGNPVQGANLVARAGFTLKTHLGDINLKVTDAGKIMIDARNPDSVILGGDLAAFHAAKFEPLQEFLTTLCSAIDARISIIETAMSSNFTYFPPGPPPCGGTTSLIEAIKSLIVALN